MWSHPPRGPLLIASFNSAGNRLTSPWNICNFRSPLESLCNHWALQPPPSRSRGESCCCCFCLVILCRFFPPSWSQRLNLKCAALELHKVFVLAEKQAEALKFTKAAVHMSHSLARRRAPLPSPRELPKRRHRLRRHKGQRPVDMLEQLPSHLNSACTLNILFLKNITGARAAALLTPGSAERLLHLNAAALQRHDNTAGFRQSRDLSCVPECTFLLLCGAICRCFPVFQL